MKKIILTVLAASLIIGSCTGCLKRKNDSTYTSEAINTMNNVDTVTTETTDNPDLISPNSNIQADSENPLEISAYDFFYEDLLTSRKLVYDTNTKVIYIRSTYGDFTPYLSENGNYCRYIDGEIVDIEK